MIELLNDQSGQLQYYPHFFDPETAKALFQKLKDELDWRAETIRLFGKFVLQPRLMGWYGDPGAGYTYSGRFWEPDNWTQTLFEIKQLIETELNLIFNSVLANLYRNGKDSMGWHADNEPELGREPNIASVSLGGKRRFCIRHRREKNRKFEIELESGSLLVMSGAFQQYYLHSVPKTAKPVSPRINLTFRRIIL